LRKLILLAAAVAAGCGGSGSHSTKTLVLVVNAPFSRTPFVGETIARGAGLAVDEINARGGIASGDDHYRLRIKRFDNALSPGRAVRNVRRAVEDDAIAIVDEGTGVDASWPIANRAHIPIGIVYQGGIGLVDAERRPNVFRIAPTDRGVAFRLAEYLIPKGLKIALLHDDTGYGQQGAEALAKAFGSNPEAVAIKLTLPGGATDFAPQVLRARRAHATALLVWAQGPTVAGVLSAARASGWNVPVYTPPSGEDPLVRQQLADRPEWVDGLTFASGRMTAEVGPALFESFRERYEAAYGAEKIGVRTPAGRPVVQPPDYAMYPYDFVNVLAAAIQSAKSADGENVIRALEEVTTRGANGDERGFNRRNHEGVVDDDVYFARFSGMTYRPVKDDPLSSTLPVISQQQ
jgi:ABC-type branched-subunit amino acid transport system substrate-binding protein